MQYPPKEMRQGVCARAAQQNIIVIMYWANIEEKGQQIISRDVNVLFFCERTFRFFCPLEKNLFCFVFVFEFKEKQRFVYCLLIKSLFLFLNVLLSFIV